MKNIFDIDVSIFANYRSTTPKTVKLMTWLKSSKYAEKVNTIRCTDDKKERDRIKATLPAITPSGLFKERKADGLVQHSGFIQIDVDNVFDIESTKNKIISIPNVAYCGLSVSGRGLWGLIPIAEPKYHKKYFKFIEKAFASMGITIDTSCKDVSRLRGYSFDANAYFNLNATPLNKYFTPKRKKIPQHYSKPLNSDFEGKRINYCLNELKARKIDITTNYNDWISLGFAFASLGESGRNYFHAVSQIYPDYDFHETEKVFSSLLKKANKGDLGTFFGKCRDVGVKYKDRISPTQKPIRETYEYPKSWDYCEPDFTDKWQLLNHLVNEGMGLKAAERYANNENVRELIEIGFNQVYVI